MTHPLARCKHICKLHDIESACGVAQACDCLSFGNMQMFAGKISLGATACALLCLTWSGHDYPITLMAISLYSYGQCEFLLYPA